MYLVKSLSCTLFILLSEFFGLGVPKFAYVFSIVSRYSRMHLTSHTIHTQFILSCAHTHTVSPSGMSFSTHSLFRCHLCIKVLQKSWSPGVLLPDQSGIVRICYSFTATMTTFLNYSYITHGSVCSLIVDFCNCYLIFPQ